MQILMTLLNYFGTICLACTIYLLIKAYFTPQKGGK